MWLKANRLQSPRDTIRPVKVNDSIEMAQETKQHLCLASVARATEIFSSQWRSQCTLDLLQTVLVRQAKLSQTNGSNFII